MSGADIRSRSWRRGPRRSTWRLIGVGLLTGAIGLLTQWSVVTVKASVKPFSSRFRASLMDIGNAAQYVRTGGSGPAVLLLHGFGDTGDMWQPLAEVLIADHTVVVPDLRGMGLSTHPEAGYEKTSQARDLASILDRLEIDRVTLVTHDIGNIMVISSVWQYEAGARRARVGWIGG